MTKRPTSPHHPPAPHDHDRQNLPPSTERPHSSNADPSSPYAHPDASPYAPPVFTALLPVVLASGSPRRSQFLRELGIPFSVHTAPDAEPAPQPDENPEDYARRAALAKTLPVAEQHREACVIGADTIVVLGREIMGKPLDNDHALDMLSRLAGTTHEVITGVCVVMPQSAASAAERIHTFAVSTRVTMAPQSRTALLAYIRTGEPADKAGAYAIQGIGSFLVERIDGSWSNVVGLPLTRVVETLILWGVIHPEPGDSLAKTITANTARHQGGDKSNNGNSCA